MTRIFVYYDLADRLATACALIGAAARQGKDFLVFAPDRDLAAWIDRMLWTQSPLGFIPHCAVDSPLATATPVLIASDRGQLDRVPPDHSRQRLLNLADDIAPGFERYASLIEVVGQDGDDRQRARLRAQQYKAQGCEIRFMEH